MGIRNLYKLIAQYAPSAIKIVPIEYLSGWTICIDASLVIYQWCTVGTIVNQRGELINHLQGVLFRTAALLSYGIIPIYVFDGPPPMAKNSLIERRIADRAHGRAAKLPADAINEVKKVLDLMGVCTVESPAEAEAQAAAFTRTGSANAIATEDMDALAFGATIVIRGLNNAAKTVTLINIDAILSGLGLNQDEFIDMCILMGCDYTEKVPGIGYHRARKLINLHRRLENMEGCIKLPTGYIEARSEFKNPATINTIPQTPSPNIDELQTYLLDRGLAENRISKTLAYLRSM